MKSKKPFDFWIFMTVLILLALGTIMVFSASAPWAYNNNDGDAYFYLKKQLTVLPVGFAGMIVAMNFNYKKLGKLSPILLVISIVLLIVVAIPGIGVEANGARRWINIGPGFQPSEFAKMAVIIFFSYSLSKRKDQLSSFAKGLLPYLVIIGVVALPLVLLQKHLSATLVIVSVSCVILFCAGAKMRHFLLMVIPAVAGLAAAIIIEPFRMRRIYAFLDPLSDPQGSGWQIKNSLYAIGSGGLFGKGLGKSMQKFLYLPEPHNDFILSILAEELGFIGVFVVLMLFLILIWRGIKVSINAPDTFGSLMAIGITSLIAIQVIINVAVVTSSMPTTGMPLPFFSYGGTSLLFLMAEVGILLNISRYANYDRL
ncbi:cell division protein FtsW [Anaerobacterium chartisolvens]|uniref:Probable peptidoglycan glycosyltransferase FtsW n=1 Tax=Anaerobacterium chartisolvens TaxID=1297424 RepID=A0A369B4V4_9FIRM|nr:putative lipid II flippase FtsW [Anaerobacterium chartisolvens]RCX16559.1 cell division protein FtsW [Anaerobacterium chartisolvens]